MFGAGKDILLIGGAAEARAMALRITGRASVILPDPERMPRSWPIAVAPQPFTAAGLAERLGHGIRLLIDASHPNDWRASQIAAEAARDAGIRVLRLERAPWRPGRRDHWVPLRRDRDARHHVAPGARVFLGTGREGLKRFACLNGCYIYCRQISDHNDVFPLPRGRFLKGAAPFGVAQEMALLRQLRIDWVILRNAGGPGGWPKLQAARNLGLRVGMIDRPKLPDAVVVRDVASAMKKVSEWLD